MHYFITATDTNAGKTYVTCLLLEVLQRRGLTALGYKPVVCGPRDDAAALLQAGSVVDDVDIDTINPLWLKTPLSPQAAALIENRQVDLDLLIGRFQELAPRADVVLVEGAGGWETPFQPGITMADLAQQLALPVLLVVDNKLGALNHSLLTLRSIHDRGLKCVGILLNHPRDERDPASISNRMVLESHMGGVPVLAEIMHGEAAIDWPL